MAELFPSLVAGLLPRIGQKPAIEGGMHSWLLDGSYPPINSVEKDCFELEIVRVDEFVKYMSFDYERFSLSCVESFLVAGLEREYRSVASWPFIKSYYAAFYAAHAIMRSQGFGSFRMKKKEAEKVSDIFDIYGLGEGVANVGTYSFYVEERNGRWVAVFKISKKGSGVHDQFWIDFCHFLDFSAKSASIRSAADSSQFLAGVTEVLRAITISGTGGRSWLSQTRNEVNYEHMHEVWLPIRRAAKTTDRLDVGVFVPSDTVRMDGLYKKDPLRALAEVCKYLACLNFEIAEFVAKRSSVGRAFGQKWRRVLSACAEDEKAA